MLVLQPDLSGRFLPSGFIRRPNYMPRFIRQSSFERNALRVVTHCHAAGN
jgi:hypothetical protein